MEEQAVPGATCSSVNIDASLSISNLAAPLLAGFLFVLIGLRGIILIDTTLPAAYLAAGPLADYVFEPLMRPGGQLANRLPWHWTDVCDGRALLIVVSALAWGNPRIRNVEDELPDVIIQAEPAAAEAKAPAAAD